MTEIRHRTVFDSEQQRAGTTYARALLGASERAGVTETVMAEFASLVRDVLDKLPKWDAALTSPRIPYERKEQMLDRALRGKMHPLLLNFLKVVARRGRFDCLRAIGRALQDEYNLLRGRVEVDVCSAESLDSAAQSAIAERLRSVLGREVHLRLRVDPAIVAGLTIRVGDTVYDGSVVNQLARMREEILNHTNQQIRLNLDRFAVER
jgi:F-type H+-transporting ATPase subunit delta